MEVDLYSREIVLHSDFTGKLYICGGFNGQECLRSAESYDSATNQWTMLATMRNRRSGVGIIAYRCRS